MREFLETVFPNVFELQTLGSVGRVVLRIVFIALLARLTIGTLQKVGTRLFAFGEARPRRFRHLDEGRAKTIRSLVESVVFYVVWFIAGIMILDSLGINTASLLAAAGVAGLAIGFGAQNLVKDVVSGFFILFENQFQVGDYVTTANVSGYVERTGLRTTAIRGFGGELHIIPNGEMRQVTNHMGPKMRVLVYVSIAHDEDVDRAVAVLNETFEQERAAGRLDDMIEGPRVLGVQDLADDGVELLVWGRAKTMTQFTMTRHIRGLVREVLVDHGIKMGYTRRHVILDGPVADEPPAS